MTDARTGIDEIPYLIRLLDDESETVREVVGNKLFRMRDVLDAELEHRGIKLGEKQCETIEEIFREEARRKAVADWAERSASGDSAARLEEGMEQIAGFLRGYRGEEGALRAQLGDLEAKCRFKGVHRDIDALNDYLFCSGRFMGNRNDYYGPQNSDLTWVLETGRGNPISLACVLILVGRRCGLEVDGCNYPGHFLARYESGGEIFLIDCFNRGKVIPGADLIEHQPFSSHEVSEAVENPATAEVILMRVLRNLETAFSRIGNRKDQRVVRKLMQIGLP